MAIVVRGSERVKYSELFNKMFRLRYETFICNRGWALPHRNGLEIDEYDTDDTVYFIALDGEGNIESTLRITPPCAGGLTEDCFPHLVESVANLSNPSVCELTRYIVVPRRYHGIDERAHKTAILVTMLEWALAEGMTAIRAVIPSHRFFVTLHGRSFLPSSLPSHSTQMLYSLAKDTHSGSP